MFFRHGALAPFVGMEKERDDRMGMRRNGNSALLENSHIGLLGYVK